MGKAMIVFGFWMLVCAICLTYQDSVKGLSPGLTLSDAIFNNNALQPYLQTDSSSGVTTFNNSLGGVLPTRSSTGTETGDFSYPDWTQSIFGWTEVFSPVIDFIGTPYFIFMFMSPGGDAAVFGALFSIINLVLIVGWFTGRID